MKVSIHNARQKVSVYLQSGCGNQSLTSPSDSSTTTPPQTSPWRSFLSSQVILLSDNQFSLISSLLETTCPRVFFHLLLWRINLPGFIFQLSGSSGAISVVIAIFRRTNNNSLSTKPEKAVVFIQFKRRTPCFKEVDRKNIFVVLYKWQKNRSKQQIFK